MSGTTDKIKGIANEAVGKAKQGIGEITGSDKLKAEGAAQEAKGDAQKAMGDAKNATKDAIDKTADALKKPL
ncbi:CsbD family protein [Rhodopseudomonas boonkerdii]|uniref:CsbD family protein n=1 Tax=Rhodopseudomonas boonkerdii TaxID=475937 RepID=UPI001E57DB34|nr:CsbD family protein [Rhodopseudomonas boonkerdii]UGV26128.1 CsbD family protein [Rhodopseudomonas boonkerdii]